MSVGTRRDKHRFCTARGCEDQEDGSPENLAHLGPSAQYVDEGVPEGKGHGFGDGWMAGGVHLWVLDRLGKTAVLFGTFPGHCQQGASRGHR